MFDPFKRMLACLSFPLIALVALGQQPVDVQVVPTMVNLTDAPLKLLSINSTMADFLHEVKTENMSGRVIESFRLGVVYSVPAACGMSEDTSVEHLFPSDRVGQLEPGKTYATYDYGLKPSDVTAFGRNRLARASVAQLAVVEVHFADGGSWSADRTPYSPYSRYQLRQQGNALCSASPAVAMGRAKQQQTVPHI